MVYDIDPALKQIEENIPKQEKSSGIGLQGKNDSGKVGYMGPCPPSGTHRYIARLFALDIDLNLKIGASQQEVTAPMEGHIFEKSALMAHTPRKRLYSRFDVMAVMTKLTNPWTKIAIEFFQWSSAPGSSLALGLLQPIRGGR